MRRAVAVAYKGMNEGYGGPFGAVIVRDGKVIAEAHNEVLHSNDARRRSIRYLSVTLLIMIEVWHSKIRLLALSGKFRGGMTAMLSHWITTTRR